jgi:hypothetical protein
MGALWHAGPEPLHRQLYAIATAAEGRECNVLMAVFADSRL